MRIAIFTDGNNPTTSALVRSTLRLAAAREDIEVCAVVTSRPHAFQTTRAADARRWARRLVVAAANPAVRPLTPRRARLDLIGLTRTRGIPLLSPPSGDPNEPGFIERLRETTRPDVALSYQCGRIWRPALLGAFAHAVNYHDGLLPAYKGVAATPFSLYHCESESGFTFHHMTEGIDAGPILEQRAVPIDEHSRVAEVDRRKAAAAVAALPRLLDRIAAGDRGRPQTEPGRYFSRADYRTVIEVPRPELVTTVELQRRIRAFGVVLVTIDGVAWPVTRLRAGRPGHRLSFRSADGSVARADRILGLPARFPRTTSPARARSRRSR